MDKDYLLEIQQRLSDLHKDYMPSESELLPMDALREMIDHFGKTPLHKAIVPVNQLHQQAAPTNLKPQKHEKHGMQSLFLDDMQIMSTGGYFERPSGINFEGLRNISIQVPILNAIVLTRTRQVQRFCRVSEMDNKFPGFEIRHVDRDHSITKSEQEQCKYLAKFLSNCGDEFSTRQRKKLRRDSFGQFIGKLCRDSLTLDSAPIETEMNHKGEFSGLYAVDGATIRLCPEDGYLGNQDYYAVQVINGRTTVAYTFDDLIYEPRNMRSDVTVAGYGLAETELLVRVVTGFVNAMTVNNNIFDKNSIPKGVLHLIGNYTKESMDAFQIYWENLVRGVDNSMALPILKSSDANSMAKFEKFGVDFNEMMFAKWMTFLTSLSCAIYGMSPSEINFDSFSGGNTSTLGGSDTAEKLAASKDSGLRPLLAYFENVVTDNVISEFNPDLCFRWTGLDPEDEGRSFEKITLSSTINELRATQGMPKIEEEWGDAPINASTQNTWMQLKANQQQQEQDQQQPDGQDLEEPPEEGDDNEPLKKSLSETEPLLKAESDIWQPAENPFVSSLLENYTQNGMIRLSAIRVTLMEWLAGKYFNNIRSPEWVRDRTARKLAFNDNWTADDLNQAEQYLKTVNPDTMSVEDTALLAKMLVKQQMPREVMINEAVNHAAQSMIMGAAQAYWQGKNNRDITPQEAKQLQETLPKTLEGVSRALAQAKVAQATLDYGSVRAAENITRMVDKTRSSVATTLMEHQVKKLAGDDKATAKKLEQDLFDKFADLNRDWRRIAVTETTELSNQGFVAGHPIGTKLRRFEEYKGACKFCESIHGKILTIVDADKPDKNGDTEVWVGKTNIGRSSSAKKHTEEGMKPREDHEKWWIAAGAIHPHCRGWWVKMKQL